MLHLGKENLLGYTMKPFIRYFSLLLSFSLFFLFSTGVNASDKEKEKRWADQISDSLLDGEAIQLNDGTADFLAIFTEAENPKDVGVIIIHGIGIHPDWPSVIQPLRVRLAENGWNTLSLQMPILGNDANVEDYEPLMKEVPARIDAGIRYLFKQGAKKIVIVAHSLGAQMSSYYLAHKKIYQEAQTQTPIIAFIGIGMGAGNVPYLKQIKIPVVDIYGEKDLPTVLGSVDARAKAANSNKHYQQKKVAGANHFFEDQDDDLVKTVTDALKKYK